MPEPSAENQSKENIPMALWVLLMAGFLLTSCGGDKELIPRPKGYYEIAFPKKEYQKYDSLCPFTFEYPVYARIRPFTRDLSKTCWFDVTFPAYKATLHLSYENVGKNFVQFSEDQHTLAYKHTSKANAIEEIFVEAPRDRVWGIIYDIQGDAASNYQFHVTDSKQHFLRGSLYFDFKANPDSTLPVLEFLKKDVTHLVETVKWK
jgi:gliding motility-associated lipoprotein GldD